MMVSPHREKPFSTKNGGSTRPEDKVLQAHSCKDYRKWATKTFLLPSPDMDGHAGFTFQVNPPISPCPTRSGSCRCPPSTPNCIFAFQNHKSDNLLQSFCSWWCNGANMPSLSKNSPSSFLQVYPSCLKSSVQQRTCFLHQMRMTKLTSYICTCLHPPVCRHTRTFLDWWMWPRWPISIPMLHKTAV